VNTFKDRRLRFVGGGLLKEGIKGRWRNKSGASQEREGGAGKREP